MTEHELNQVRKNVKNPFFLIVLNGGLIFSGQILSKINILYQMDYSNQRRNLKDIFVLNSDDQSLPDEQD